MKLLIVAFLLMGIVLCTQGLGQNQVQTWGTHKYNERLVHHQLMSKSGSMFSFGLKQKELKYPQKVIRNNYRLIEMVSFALMFIKQGIYNYQNITFIQVTDQLNEKDCRAFITSGGPGFREVSMLFQGPGRKGYNFIWEIYAA